MAVQQQLVIITTTNVHFLFGEKPWASLTPHSEHFPKVRTGWLDDGRTGNFDNETGFYQEFSWKTMSFLHAI